jgi:hypothetical protein
MSSRLVRRHRDDLAVADDLMLGLSRLGLRRTEKRRPGEYPMEGHAGRQGPLPGAHQSEWPGGRFSDVRPQVWCGGMGAGSTAPVRAGEWLDPCRGQVPLSVVAEMWLESRRTVKRRRWKVTAGRGGTTSLRGSGVGPVASITTADVSSWLGDMMRRGLARSTATRALATLRSLLSFAVADGRVTVNAAAAAKAPTGGPARREGRFLDLDEVVALAQACRGPYAELVYVLAMHGLRWGELAGLQVGDQVMVPTRGCGCHGRF